MKRWLLPVLALAIIAASILVVRWRLTPSGSPLPGVRSHLLRVPNSAYKYHLCGEAFAFKLAAPDNPYKTDETFSDPFRHIDDTIIPRFLGYEAGSDTVSFSVKLIFNHVATYNETILHVHRLDGISILIPDGQNKLQHASVPQFIISDLPLTGPAGEIAVIDYTCPEQWVWSAVIETIPAHPPLYQNQV
jgi:hypothetical protein